ncbi:tetratricopeptide repeat protein [Roseomonas sp. CECT 9278]|uniref:O-linked N-acetylglucosamine transferase, SPINDLY family protein n=1 Tax=Roseomonas sp. CECT 9278 TaxID=2845823 RepID=UPI001E55CC4E|nr:tetratricopeptide repeat protein [Roseomonas sp. CECT 9278]CAH0234795.1 Beta-barrel assembly-enhancing protease [Roseomonas sp. CECT 9278]
MPSPADGPVADAIAHHAAGRFREAVAGYQAALAGGLDTPELRNNLAHALRLLGQPEAALAQYAEALRQRPDYLRALLGRADAAEALNRLPEAAEALAAAIPLSPDPDPLRIRLAGLHGTMNRPDRVVALLRAVAPGGPDQAVVHNNLGNALMACGRPSEAIGELRAAAALLPGRTEVQVNLAHALMASGRPAEAAAACGAALDADPDCWPAWHNRLLALNYLPEVTPAAIAEEHRRFGARIAARIPAMAPPANTAYPGRRLRIGFVSGDLRTHPVGQFLDGVVAAHDQAGFALFAYANQGTEDAVSARLRAHLDGWRQVLALDDAALAAAVRADGIDILVDLSGHTGGTRIAAFARRPAPVQVAWIGYPQTTGLAAMDWIIADPTVLPPQDEPLYAERVMRLPGCYLCYGAPLPGAPGGPPPMVARGHATFGCFGGLAKINDSVLAAWARILAALPTARILVKTRALGEAETAAALRARFAAQGGDAARLDLEGHLPATHHHARFADLDLMLDPFPYGGCTGTVEAIHAGVPTLGLRGRGGMMTRSAETLLAQTGMADWVAADVDSYVAMAVRMGRDPAALAAARARVSPAPLRDAAGFARGLEAAWRAMWRDWCARQH